MFRAAISSSVSCFGCWHCCWRASCVFIPLCLCVRSICTARSYLRVLACTALSVASGAANCFRIAVLVVSVPFKHTRAIGRNPSCKPDTTTVLARSGWRRTNAVCTKAGWGFYLFVARNVHRRSKIRPVVHRGLSPWSFSPVQQDGRLSSCCI